ncbi:MAG: hypothetical protein AAB214_11920 [Fibrobacterota bacterium]|mgnify:CR=1 FL=1
METFQSVFGKIADAIKDFTSLEVTLYKGSISIDSTKKLSEQNFDSFLDGAAATSKIRIVATTKSHLDGDTETFFDDKVTDNEIEIHQKLLEAAAAKRAAVMQLFESAIKAAVAKVN